MRRLPLFAILSLLSLAAIAQSPPELEPGDRQYTAYRLFSVWVRDYQADTRLTRKIVESSLYGAGALSIAAAPAVWYGGDAVSRYMSDSPLNPDVKQGLTLGFGLGGAALIASGLVLRSLPIKDYRTIYAEVFEEADPELREAMAADILRYQAGRGRDRRMKLFFTGLAVPFVKAAVEAGINLSQDHQWSDGVLASMATSIPNIAGSIVALFNKTSEERVYERYRLGLDGDAAP